MSNYREVRVRPVVRYIVTDYELEDDGPNQSQRSTAYGVFDNVEAANRAGRAIAAETPGAVFEPARALRIHWIRGPGEPKENIRWELSEENGTRSA